MSHLSRVGILAAYRDGVTVVCELATQFTDATWLAATPCTEWRAVDVAGHLRCVADDYHEYLDDAPASRLARLMATGVPADSLARKLARQNSAELAALPDGAVVRWAEVDISTAELPAGQFGELLSERTRLVAVTAASNVVGTRPDVAAIAAAAHAVGALCYVDGVHATPHVRVDMRILGADFYATSAYKWSGPHIGTVVADPSLLETLSLDKLVPAPRSVPGRFERGTPGFADLAGVVAAVEHLASLDPSAAGSRRERLQASMTTVAQYEADLFARLLGGLSAMGHVTLYGNAARRAPTAFFTVAGYSPRAVAERLAASKVNVWNGDNYAWELTGAFGLRDSGGAVRAGLVHYNDAADVARLLAAVAELA